MEKGDSDTVRDERTRLSVGLYQVRILSYIVGKLSEVRLSKMRSNRADGKRGRVMKLDDNPQMVAMLDHAKGSLENKIRQAYNSGYNDGFKAGVFEAWDDMREQLDKSLRQQIKQTERKEGE